MPSPLLGAVIFDFSALREKMSKSVEKLLMLFDCF